MVNLGPSISYRGPFPEHGGQYTAVYALPGDVHWRTVTGADTKPSLFDTPREAEALAGHVLCAKLRQKPIDIPEPLRTELKGLLNDLMDWRAIMGGFEAPVWGKMERLRERLISPPLPVKVGAQR